MIDLQTIKSDMGMLLAELRTAGAEGEDTKHLRCPWHDDQHGSLSAFADKEGMARFKCLACGQGGTIVDARMRTAGYSVSEAIESLRSSDGPNPATRRPVLRR